MTGQVGKTATFWDLNRSLAEAPQFWMANPICRRVINRRITGSEDQWPLDWFQQRYGQIHRERGLSFGSGLGAFERAAMKLRLVRRLDAYDLSPASIADARRAAEAEGINGIEYSVGNFDDPRLPESAYDIVFFHGSLHHVSNLEGLFQALSRSLREGGEIYVDEYVGRSRHQWRRSHLRPLQRLLDRVPENARLRSRIDYPVSRDDPSEAVRSAEISGFLEKYFDPVEWRPYGGQLAGWVLSWVSPDWMLAAEDRELLADPSRSDYLVAYGRLKTRAVSSGRAHPAGSRVRRSSRRLAQALFELRWLAWRVFRRLQPHPRS